MATDFAQLRSLPWKDPRVLMRAVLGVLLGLNLIAFYFVMYPLGGSPQELDQQVAGLRQQGLQQRKNLERLRVLSTKVESARRQSLDFENNYFTDRQVVYSTIVGELTRAAEEAGIRVKDHALVNDDIEGSDTLSMITVTANYEGTFTDLLNYVNRIDRSPRFIILDSLGAAPQQNSNVLNVAMRMHVFVRNPQGPPPSPDALGGAVLAKPTSAPAPASNGVIQ
jgi:type IV pilus assembly protein PilO